MTTQSQKSRITLDEAKAGMATATGELWAAYNTIVSLHAAVAALQEAYDEQEKLLNFLEDGMLRSLEQYIAYLRRVEMVHAKRGGGE